MWLDKLGLRPASENLGWLAAPTAKAISLIPEALVFEIDPADADTGTLTSKYDLPLSDSGNAVLISGSRQGQVRHCCCMTPADRRVDVNHVVRQRLDVRKCSFASMDEAVAVSGMEYGAITPIGLPDDWPVWLDEYLADLEWVLIGSGIRTSKLVVPGKALLRLPGVQLVQGLTIPFEG
jgi:prolyl-tRNA editing enzyme YbaK/EbsC (Cys-tRNA(Pro) deacylase)